MAAHFETAETVNPDPSATITSLRAVGYSIATAVADLIDNSISAAANNVWIYCDWNNAQPWVAILDDGRGMSETELLRAMCIGSADPEKERERTDLGRFGLGLKTASFSQARTLSVHTKTDSHLTVNRTWDLDHVRTVGQWELLRNTPCPAPSLISKLEERGQGTLVIWQNMDRFAPNGLNEGEAHQHFLRAQDAIRSQLEVIFHRYLSGTTVDKRKLSIYLNGAGRDAAIRPWDPFHRLRCDQLTEQQPVGLSIGKSTEIFGLVLPHRDHLDETSLAELQRPGPLTQLQGLYIYRADRIIAFGDWFDLLGLDGKRLKKEEVFRLARVGINIQNSDDELWRIDIKKSSATPPALLRKEIESYAVMVREKAKRVYWHRSRVGPNPTHFAQEPEVPIWKDFGVNKRLRYEINRSHDIIDSFRSACGILADKFERVLKLVERTVPIERIYIQSTSGEFASDTRMFDFDESLKSDAEFIFGQFFAAESSRERNQERAFDQAVAKLRRVEPFNRIPDLHTLCQRFKK